MKVKLPKNLDPSNQPFLLNKSDIEAQAIDDLIKYKKLYYERYKKPAPLVLDVDNFVKELWGFDIVFDSLSQDDPDSEILGKLDPAGRKIIVDDSMCGSPRRVSFTVAHEAGHLSLHASMFRLVNGVVVDWSNEHLKCFKETNSRQSEINNIRKEWQANQYAGALLAPKIEIINLLKEIGLVKSGEITPVDLQIYAEIFQNKFGLSRHALEIRLGEMGISLLNRKYAALTTRKAA